MDFVSLWPAQSSLLLHLAKRMCGHGLLTLPEREVNPDPLQQASSPPVAHLPCSSLFLFLIYLTSLLLLCAREFPVFAQAVGRGPIWGPL